MEAFFDYDDKGDGMLDVSKVKVARDEEMKYVRKHGVYGRRTRKECY